MQTLVLCTHVLALTIDRIVQGNPQSLCSAKVSLKIRIFKMTREFMEIIYRNCMHSVLAGKLQLALRPQLKQSTAISHYSKGSKSLHS